VLDAINHKETDRIPITYDAENEVYDALYNHLGISTREALFDCLHVDTWMILPGNFIYPDNELSREIKTSIWGYKTQLKRYSGGTYDELVYSPLAGRNERADIDLHEWPADDLQDFSHFPDQARSHSDRAILGVFTWGAYFIATHVRGIQNLLIDMAVNKRYAHHLIGTIAEKSGHYLEILLSRYGAGTDIIFMADDYCSQQAPFFSPELFKEYVVPYLSRYVELVHKYGKKFLLHVCGAVRPLLPMIIDAGVDMLEPIQTRAEGMDPIELKRDFGAHICFYGGMDLQQILCKGTEEDVRGEARRLIDVLGKNGGYVFGPGHTYIQIDAPVTNILAMYDEAVKYYPHRL